MTDRATLPDLSYYCSNVDFLKLKARGAPGVILRSSWGITQDTRYTEYRTQAFAADLPILSYHYLDWRWDVLQQADVFSRIITTGKTATRVFPILDIEMDPVPYNYQATPGVPLHDLMPETRKMIGQTTKPYAYAYRPGAYSMTAPQVQENVHKWLDRVEHNTGEIPARYHGYYYWLQWMSDDPEWLKYPLWLAWWAQESIIKVPPPSASWWMWQYTGHGNGPEWGQQSLDADLNLYHDTATQFLADYGDMVAPPNPPLTHTMHECKVCGATWPVTPPPVTPPPSTFPQFRVTNCQYANVRGPSSANDAPVLFLVKAGDILTIDTTDTTTRRAHIKDTQGWVGLDYITPA